MIMPHFLLGHVNESATKDECVNLDCLKYEGQKNQGKGSIKTLDVKEALFHFHFFNVCVLQLSIAKQIKGSIWVPIFSPQDYSIITGCWS